MKRRIIVPVLILNLTIHLLSAQVSPNINVPEIKPASVLLLPPIKSFDLANGLKIFTIQYGTLPIISTRIVFGTGTAADPVNKDGLANLTAQMITNRGTEWERPESMDSYDSNGSEYTTETSSEFTAFTVRATPENFLNSLGILANLIQSPTMDSAAFENLRQDLNSAVRRWDEFPEQLAKRMVLRQLFGKISSYGHDQYGNEESLSSISLEDVKAFHERYYRPENALIVISGPEIPEDIAEQINSWFGFWSRGEDHIANTAPAATMESDTVLLINHPYSHRVEVCIGFPAAGDRSSDYETMLLLQSLLRRTGDPRYFPFFSDMKQYTDTLKSMYLKYRETGSLLLQFNVPEGDADSALSHVFNIIQSLREREVSSFTLERAKQAVIQELPSRFETVSEVGREVADLYGRNGIQANYFFGFERRIQGVTPGDVRRAADRYFKLSKISCVCIGNALLIKKAVEQTVGKSVKIIDAGDR